MCSVECRSWKKRSTSTSPDTTKNPKPFTWTATADLILERVKTFVNELPTQDTSSLVKNSDQPKLSPFQGKWRCELLQFQAFLPSGDSCKIVCFDFFNGLLAAR